MRSLMKKTFVITSLLATSVAFASADPHWTYDEPWENLSNTTTPTKASDLPYAECGLGLKQSPVDLNAVKAVKKLSGKTLKAFCKS